ncbi:hypothetical protein [Streptomyces sp. CBMA152]|uniref:hypothetical protein n=1 Tax=Streptomyces sp. CBMA152 TaxID=1896312 RepID=UPI0016602067|nr:hypothetical protein [Streptomyces sp. CBMA152]MBD0742171.1 hypothetical protein [Streptomyces sp. CBMA152]
MGWIDRQHIHLIADDPRYQRLINLSKRLLEERVPTCGNGNGGTITTRDNDGNETTVTCDNCQGTGTVGTTADNEDNGPASGGR